MTSSDPQIGAATARSAELKPRQLRQCMLNKYKVSNRHAESLQIRGLHHNGACLGWTCSRGKEFDRAKRIPFITHDHSCPWEATSRPSNHKKAQQPAGSSGPCTNLYRPRFASPHSRIRSQREEKARSLSRFSRFSSLPRTPRLDLPGQHLVRQVLSMA